MARWKTLALITCSLIGFGLPSLAHPKDTPYLSAQAAQAEELVKQLEPYAERQPTTSGSKAHHFESVLQQLIKLGPASEKPLQSKLKKDEARREELEKLLEKRFFEIPPINVNRNAKEEANRIFRAESQLTPIQNEIVQLSGNLELLTALRRVQKKPDPLSIQIVRGVPPSAIPGKLPTLDVLLTSVDFEKKSIWCQTAPNGHGTHRHPQYRFEVRDAAGKLLPVIPNRSSSRRYRGRRGYGWLEFGEYFHANLPIADFVDIREPGEYSLTVLYHSNLPIADITDPTELGQLIFFRSDSIKLTVDKGQKLLLRNTQKDRQAVNSLIAKLPNDGEIKVVGSSFHYEGRLDDQADFGFVSPQSPAGKILALSWNALPALLDSLSNSKLSRHQKAWVLSLLFSITVERDLDPVRIGIQPNWNHSKKYGSSENATDDSFAQKIIPQEQDKLIAKWKDYRQRYLDIRETNEP